MILKIDTNKERQEKLTAIQRTGIIDIVLAAVFLCAVSCNTPPDPKPEEVANAFLSAYYLADFDQILSLCTSGSEFASDMARNAQFYNSYTPEAWDILHKELEDYHFTIQNVTINRSKDSAFVHYLVFTPLIPEGAESRLTLVKEEDEWKIAKLL